MTCCGCGCDPETSGSWGRDDKGWGCTESFRFKQSCAEVPLRLLVRAHIKGSLTAHRQLQPCKDTCGICGLVSAHPEDGKELTSPGLFVCVAKRKLDLDRQFNSLVALRLGPRAW